jgi:hypothetical protein
MFESSYRAFVAAGLAMSETDSGYPRAASRVLDANRLDRARIFDV